MKKNNRRKEMLEVIKSHPIITPFKLASIFDVSVETIRNDLIYLEEKGAVVRVHGSVAAASQRGLEIPYNMRETVNVIEKKEIAKEALKHIEPGDSIVLGTGTTIEEMAKLLVNSGDFTIITPSVNIANIFANDKENKVFLIGGWLRKEGMLLYGNYSIDLIKKIHVDKCFISAAGVSSKYGVTDYFEGEVGLVRAIIDISREKYLLADNSKFGNVSLLSVVPINQFDKVITDDKSSDNEINKLRKINVDVTVVKTS